MNQYLIFTNYDLYDLEQEAVKGNPGHPFRKDRSNDTTAMEFCSIGTNFIEGDVIDLHHSCYEMKEIIFWDHLYTV